MNMNEWLECFYDEVSAHDFYRDIFPAGELEKRGEYVTGKYTGIIVSVTSDRHPDGRRKICRYTITDDLGAVDEVVESDNFCLCAPISYAGKQRTAENARMLYAVAVDVDNILMAGDEPLGLMNLMERHVELLDRVPRPTYVVSSGSGVHLYYVLTEPIPMFRNIAYELQVYKRELTRLIWHDTVVNIRSAADIQQEGIYQGFRMPGTITKNGGRARAFRTGDRLTLAEMNRHVAEKYRIREELPRNRGNALAEAAIKYPEWYERRVIQHEPRGVWPVSRNLYEWWKRKILDGATVGHRYYCVMMLAIYAKKCSYYHEKRNPTPVTREELERDSFELVSYLDSMTRSEDNHFGDDDVLDALEAYDDKWATYPRAAIEYRTAIQIPANKRNGQKRADHLEEARAIRDIRAKRRGESWDAHNGRKSKADIVLKWRRENPDGRRADCSRETGLNRKTVYRHWDAVDGDDADKK